MCGCKRIRTVRTLIKMGGDHMFSEASTSFGKIRVSRSNKSVLSFRVPENGLSWAPRETRNSDFDGDCSCL